MLSWFSLLCTVLLLQPFDGFRRLTERYPMPPPIQSQANHYLHGVFRPVEKESMVTVQHNDTTFSKMDGIVFSQIGSNPRLLVKSKDIGYHWFDGDGMIHTVTINKTTVQYMNRWVHTKRFDAEKKWGQKMYLYFGELRGIHGIIEIMKWSIVQLLALVPGAKGTANTAFLRWQNRTYALHEGDFPYRIGDELSTLEHFVIPNVKSVTAHPKIDRKREQLYLYGYNNQDFLEGRFYHNILNTNFELIHQSNFSLINNGMIHDIAQTTNHLIVPDLPLKYDFKKIMENKLPLTFDGENGITRFATVHKDYPKDIDWYNLTEQNIFIFHFTDYAKETTREFIIFACVMDFLDMEDFIHLDNPEYKIRGNLRLQQLILDKKTKTVKIVKNSFLENIPELDGIEYNMDFPIMSQKNSKSVYCTIFNAKTGKIIGFTFTELDSYHERTNNRKNTSIYYGLPENVYANCEPQVTIVNKREYLVCFTYSDYPIHRSFLSLIHVQSREIKSIEIPFIRIPPGFHSLIYKKQ